MFNLALCGATPRSRRYYPQPVQSSCTVVSMSLPMHARIADELRGRIDRGELGLEPGTIGVEILRVRLLDGEPVMVERATFVEPVGRLLFDFDPDSGSIYAYLTAEGVDLRSARHTFDAVPAGPLESELLRVPAGAPLLRERRRATSVDGTPLEYGDDRYRPDRVTFTIDNSRPTSAGFPSDLRILKETS